MCGEWVQENPHHLHPWQRQGAGLASSFLPQVLELSISVLVGSSPLVFLRVMKDLLPRCPLVLRYPLSVPLASPDSPSLSSHVNVSETPSPSLLGSPAMAQFSNPTVKPVSREEPCLPCSASASTVPGLPEVLVTCVLEGNLLSSEQQS